MLLYYTRAKSMEDQKRVLYYSKRVSMLNLCLTSFSSRKKLKTFCCYISLFVCGIQSALKYWPSTLLHILKAKLLCKGCSSSGTNWSLVTSIFWLHSWNLNRKLDGNLIAFLLMASTKTCQCAIHIFLAWPVPVIFCLFVIGKIELCPNIALLDRNCFLGNGNILYL